MSRNGDEGGSRAGHGPNTSTSSRPSLIVKLPVPSLRNMSIFSHPPTNSHAAAAAASSAFPAASPANAPKRRGRPPKNLHRPDYAPPPPKPKVSDLPKPLATRSSKRKAAEMSGEPGVAGDSATGDGDEEDFDGNQPPRKKSRSVSQAPPMRISTRNRGRRHSNSESAIGNHEVPKEITNGHVTPAASLHKESSQSEREIQVTRTSSRARKQENLTSSNELMASIEPHERLERDGGALGVTTRAGARTRSTSIKAHAATQDDDTILSVVATEEVLDAVNGEADGIQSDAGTPLKPRGRGRWPNGAQKAKAMVAALSKKAASKKKGAPGKRKTSNDAVVQAVYDRQAHLRSSYKDLRKIIIRAEQALLDRALEELEEDPERHKKTPYYDNVMKGLDARHTKVLAQNERKDRLKRDLLERQFEANVAMTWQQHNLEVKELQEKYEMVCKRAIMDILKQAARDDDDAATVSEIETLDPAHVSAVLAGAEENEAEEVATPVELEVKKPVARGRKSAKKRTADDEPLGRRVAKRHAPAMLSATTQGGEDSEAEVAPEAPPIITTPSRQRNKYQFDEYGVCVPTESKKGAQKEEPNNRAVVKPWITFTNDEIGLRNYPEEIKETKGPIPSGYIHLDQFRGIYDISGRAEDYDEELINRHLLHPRMGLPVPGSINPDNAVPPTDSTKVLKNTPAPIYIRDEEYPDGQSTSKSWNMIMTEREWKELERRMDAGMRLRVGLGRTGLATFDAIARDKDLQGDMIEDILAASQIIEKELIEKAQRSASPEKKVATPAVEEAAPIERPPTPDTAKLLLLADAIEMSILEPKVHSPPPPPPPQPIRRQSFQQAPPPVQQAPPTPRSQSQMLSIAFINNPSPALPPLAPQVPQQQQQQQQQRPYPGPVMMAAPPPHQQPPPPPQRNMQMQYPPIQPHPPANFYGPSNSPSLRTSRSSSGLRNILPRAIPNEAPRQHHRYQQPPPPPQPQQQAPPQHHMPHEHQRFYEAPVQLPPYLGEQQQQQQYGGGYRQVAPRQPYSPYPPPHPQQHQGHQMHHQHQQPPQHQPQHQQPQHSPLQHHQSPHPHHQSPHHPPTHPSPRR
ncbi:hypothetical protein VE00_01052 [Pseudogymnoascus sp. WSF 3629]|nr:hypothetical protein VE00_01052 [Pseudogymnoascus sp. WSF 3629]